MKENFKKYLLKFNCNLRSIEYTFIDYLTPLVSFLYLVLIVILFQDTSNKEYIFTSMGAITAFWFAYQRYDRDKEFEIIEKYTEKYDEIMTNNSNNYSKIMKLWFEEFNLYKKGFIGKESWKQWSNWIVDDFIKYINNDYIDNNLELTDINGILYQFSKDYLNHKNGFSIFLLYLIYESKTQKILKITSEIENGKIEIINQDRIDKHTGTHEKILKFIEQKTKEQRYFF